MAIIISITTKCGNQQREPDYTIYANIYTSIQHHIKISILFAEHSPLNLLWSSHSVPPYLGDLSNLSRQRLGSQSVTRLLARPPVSLLASPTSFPQASHTVEPRYCHFSFNPFVIQNALLSLFHHYAPICFP